MLNVVHKTKADILTITVDLSEDHGRSASGKSVVVASTQGNQPIGDGKGTKFGLNIYRPIKD